MKNIGFMHFVADKQTSRSNENSVRSFVCRHIADLTHRDHRLMHPRSMLDHGNSLARAIVQLTIWVAT